jgi:hypothetical protein
MFRASRFGAVCVWPTGRIDVFQCLRGGAWKEMEIRCCPLRLSRLPQLLCNGPCCDWLNSSLIQWCPRLNLSRHLDNYVVKLRLRWFILRLCRYLGMRNVDVLNSKHSGCVMRKVTASHLRDTAWRHVWGSSQGRNIRARPGIFAKTTTPTND